MDFTSSQWADIIIAAFILISVIVGSIKGFFKSIIGFVVAGVSVFAGYMLSPNLVQPVTDWLYPYAKDFLYKVAQKNITMPEGSELTDEQIEAIVRPMLEPLAKVAIWVVIGIVCAIILSIIGNVIKRKVNNNEVLKKTDRMLGAVLGLLEAFVLCVLAAIVIAKLGLADNFYNSMPDSILVKFFRGLIPEDLSSLVINIPIVGEVNLKDLFNGIEIKIK